MLKDKSAVVSSWKSDREMKDDPRLFEPRYDITSAAQHLRMPRSTLAAWVRGQADFKRVLEPAEPGYLSFVNLTEAFVLFAIRKNYRIGMPEVRRAIDYVEIEMKVEHPLAFESFKTDGVHLFVETMTGHQINASRGGQTRMAGLLKDLNRIEWRRSRPITLFPVFGREKSEDRFISISPLIAFGKPVVAGTRIPTRIVSDRFFQGESVEALAEDFGLPPEAVEEAVRAESGLAAA
jgi:uncharacterized protein (DUF433 family)